MNATLLLSIIAAAVVFHALLIRFAPIVGLIDVPNGRSVHKIITPRGAGIAIFLAIFSMQALLNWDHLVTYKFIYTAIAVVFTIGVFDDLIDVTPRIKFAFIFIASILLYTSGIQIETLGNYFGYTISLPIFLLFPFTFFAIAGFTNALNLMDGLDGLAASVGLIMLSTFLAIGLTNQDILITTLSSTFIAGLGIFWFFNWNPAKIFMGDSGSLMIGFVLATLSILSLKYATPTSILFIIALPLLDTFVVMTRRIQRGQSPFKADKNHIHHFLFKIKGDVRFSVILLISIQAIFSIIGFQLREGDDLLTLTLFSLLFFVFLNLFDQRIRRRKKPKKTKRQAQKEKNQSDIMHASEYKPEPESTQDTIPKRTEAT